MACVFPHWVFINVLLNTRVSVFTALLCLSKPIGAWKHYSYILWWFEPFISFFWQGLWRIDSLYLCLDPGVWRIIGLRDSNGAAGLVNALSISNLEAGIRWTIHSELMVWMTCPLLPGPNKISVGETGFPKTTWLYTNLYSSGSC